MHRTIFTTPGLSTLLRGLSVAWLRSWPVGPFRARFRPRRARASSSPRRTPATGTCPTRCSHRIRAAPDALLDRQVVDLQVSVWRADALAGRHSGGPQQVQQPRCGLGRRRCRLPTARCSSSCRPRARAARPSTGRPASTGSPSRPSLPIVMAHMDYPRKLVGLGPLFRPTRRRGGRHGRDQALLRPVQGQELRPVHARIDEAPRPVSRALNAGGPGRPPEGAAMLTAFKPRAHRQTRAGLVNWSRTQAVPADCLCLRQAKGLWPLAAQRSARILKPTYATQGNECQPTLSKDPLHGMTLEAIVTALVEHFGWAELGQRIEIKCFRIDPSVASSLKFLRKTPWARAKVESLYLFMRREQARAAHTLSRSAASRGFRQLDLHFEHFQVALALHVDLDVVGVDRHVFADDSHQLASATGADSRGWNCGHCARAPG